MAGAAPAALAQAAKPRRRPPLKLNAKGYFETPA
jgi:hypothetical protein